VADQQLDTFDCDDEVEKLYKALSKFKGLVRDLVGLTGLSANQLADMYGFGKGKVSIWQTPRPEQPNIPPLRFIEVLTKEAQERGNLQDGAAAAFLRQYGVLLELYCARANPHDIHRKMLADFRDTLLIREMNAATNTALAELAGIAAELETLRGDRDEERLRRIALRQKIASLQRENESRAGEKNAALVRRDQIRADVAAYENGQQLVASQPVAELGDSHEYHPQVKAPVPSAPPSSGRGTKRRGLVTYLIAVCAVTVVSLAVYGAIQLVGNRGQDENTADGRNPEPPSASTPSPGGSASPSGTPSTSASAAPPKVVTPHAGEPLPLVLTPPECDTVVEIDLDKVPFTKWVTVADGEDYEAPAGVDMTWTSCSSENLRTRSGRHAGLVRRGQDVTKDRCRAAANGGGLENVKMWANLGVGNPGFVEGATMCVITDQDRLVAAKVIDMDDEDAFSFTFDVKTLT
jgi:hypothetical protein